MPVRFYPRQSAGQDCYYAVQKGAHMFLELREDGVPRHTSCPHRATLFTALDGLLLITSELEKLSTVVSYEILKTVTDEGRIVHGVPERQQIEPE